MKTIILLISIAYTITSFKSASLDEIRSNYGQSLSDKLLCEQMIIDLEKRKAESVIILGYLGGFQAIWASHLSNPMHKLNTFKKGRKNIEEAILRDPYNIELRFIRLSIQVNAPAFLSYSSHIKEDTEFIETHRNQISSIYLQENIHKILNN